MRGLSRTAVFQSPGVQLTGAGAGEASLFGDSVAISADGKYALVGAPDQDEGTGAVWVFKRSGSGWTQEGPMLTPTGEGGRYDGFGQSLALSANGELALVGAPGTNTGDGTVWVFNARALNGSTGLL